MKNQSKKILLINAGSSSIKFMLMHKKSEDCLLSGIFDGIGSKNSFLKIINNNETLIIKKTFNNFDSCIKYLLQYLINNQLIENYNEVSHIGHRVVHGGAKYNKPTIINQQVIKYIESCSDLAPLHNPYQLKLIDIMSKCFTQAKHIAIFDTAFHSQIPQENNMYAVPHDWYEKYNVRRYGFHGSSYEYVLNELLTHTKSKKLNLIVCHLGSGASCCTIKENKSIYTSMGFSPTDGLVMGTRSGDISFSIIPYMSKKLNKEPSEIMEILVKQSGLKGICGQNDMREIQQNLKDKKNQLAMKLFCKAIINYIVIAINDLNDKVDAIVFCGGIGENASIVRHNVINGIKLKNIALDKIKNSADMTQKINCISCDKSDIKVYVVKTNEELMMAKHLQNFN